MSCGYASEQKAAYGTRVTYKAGQKIEFPDFTVEYLGERRKTLPVYPRGFLYYDFKITRRKTEKVISWTTGTGIIDPTDFDSTANVIISSCAVRRSSENWIITNY